MTKYKHEYHKTLVYKIMNSRKPNQVFVTYKETLEHIKKVHKFSRGIKQIVYITGWQYEGHDSKYPAWFEGNKKLSETRDADDLDSIRRLMKEAKKYNAFVSVHINMCDAYENSPLWNEYLQQDLLCKDSQGDLMKGLVWDGDQSYFVNKTKEWECGLARKRIDKLLELLPIEEAGTIHIDVFNPKESPYHGTTVEEETETLKKIIGYFAEKGIDVTIEWIKKDLIGYVPYVWHFNLDERSRLEYPASLICGGGDAWNRLNDSVLWREYAWYPEVGCIYEEAWGRSIDDDSKEYLAEGFSKDFFLKTLPYIYINDNMPMEHIHSSEKYEVFFENDIKSSVRKSDRHLTITEKGNPIVLGTDVCIPVLWKEKKEYLAFSLYGGKKRWKLDEFGIEVKKVRIKNLIGESFDNERTIDLEEGVLELELSSGEAIAVFPQR